MKHNKKKKRRIRLSKHSVKYSKSKMDSLRYFATITGYFKIKYY